MTNPALAEAIESNIERIDSTPLARADLQPLLADVGSLLGLKQLALDDDGIAIISMADTIDLLLSFQVGFPGLLATAPLPDGSPLRGPMLRQLLMVNLSDSAQGAAFSLMPPDDTLVMSRRIDCSHGDAQRVADELFAFADNANQWRVEIELQADLVEQDDDDADPLPDPTTSPTPPMMRA